MVLTSGFNGLPLRLSKTETLTIGNNAQPQFQYPDHSRKIAGATGGFLNNDFITCGGYYSDESNTDCTNACDPSTFTDKCFKLGSEEPFATMMTKRNLAASIVLEDEKIWILGGSSSKYSDSTLSSSEYIFSDGRNEDGPPMPIALQVHAMVKINETTSFLVGGIHNLDYFYSKRTWYYNGNWIEGPDLELGRYSHSLGIIRDSVTLHEHVVASGGMGNGEYLNNVEILDVQENKWESGNLL